MNLEDIINKSNGERQILYNITYMWENNTNNICTKQTDLQTWKTKLVVTKEEREEGSNK